MKTRRTNFWLVTLVLMLLIPSSALYSQDKPERPKYVVVTTMHWNMDMEDFDMDTWKSMEKEVMDKVTRKNEHIISAGYYLHSFTADNTELLYVHTYPSWDAIDKAVLRNEELRKLAWPDDAKRKDFFKKLGSHYANMHSDEIYAPLDGAKILTEKPTKDLVLYVRKSHFAFPEDGSKKEFDAFYKEYIENVFHKNQYIKGYYPNVHAWGADKTEFVEAFYLDSLDDLDDMLKNNGELFKKHWADEGKRKAFEEKAKRYFTAYHGDYIYTYVSGI